MNNLLLRIHDRIARGFTMPQKMGLTALAIVYILSPFDVIPDVLIGLGWFDDLYVVNLLRKVWMSPTLPPKGGGGNALGSALKSKVAPTFTRAWKDFAKGFADAQGGRS